MKKFFALLMLLVFTVVLSVTTLPAEAKEEFKVAYVPAITNNSFWLAIEKPIKEAVRARGDLYVTIDTPSDQARMNDVIGDLIADKIDILLVAPLAPAEIKSALIACKDAGIPVINFETPVMDLDLVAAVVTSDNYNAGVVVARDMMEKLPRGSKVAVIHSLADGACIERIKGFYDTITNYFEVVVELDGKGDTGVTLPLAENVLQSTSDLAAFFCVNDPSALGCMNALAARPERFVLVYGVDGSPDAKKLIAAGKMTGTAAQSPNSIGSETIKAAYTILEREEVKKNIVIPTFLIDKDNVNRYGTDGWQ
ncbi:MAG: sugar ABC transporter substrate-binding protein [Fretibacterium sp.]|nr:sugar ABC transporter substrate-binding protein [Fretibacterium sp.]